MPLESALPIVTPWFVERTTDAASNSSSFGALLTLAAVPVREGARLLVLATFSISNTSVVAVANALRITVDGVAQRGAGNSVVVLGGLQAGSILVVATGLAAGAHAVALEWRTTGGTVQCRPVAAPDFEHASLFAQDIGAAP